MGLQDLGNSTQTPNKEKKLDDVKIQKEPIDTLNYSIIVLAHQS